MRGDVQFQPLRNKFAALSNFIWRAGAQLDCFASLAMTIRRDPHAHHNSTHSADAGCERAARAAGRADESRLVPLAESRGRHHQATERRDTLMASFFSTLFGGGAERDAAERNRAAL